MKKGVSTCAAVLAAGVVSWAWGAERTASGTAKASPAVERGEYLVTTSACHDCHTPKKMGPEGPEPDTSLLLSGHPEKSVLPPPPALPAGPWIAVTNTDLTAWSGPWGVSYAFNLTPDENTGIGSWSEETFVKAVRTGRHMGVARPILPPMPWQMYRNFTDADLKAIYAYLRSIPPVKNRVPEPVFAPEPATK
jgi:mono/diheme cytochrome c family protein